MDGCMYGREHGNHILTPIWPLMDTDGHRIKRDLTICNDDVIVGMANNGLFAPPMPSRASRRRPPRIQGWAGLLRPCMYVWRQYGDHSRNDGVQWMYVCRGSVIGPREIRCRRNLMHVIHYYHK